MNNIKSLHEFVNESEVNEGSFYRLPKDVIGTELYTANQNMQSLYSRLAAGNDVDPKDIDSIIKLLQQVKSLTKKFNKADEVIGTVYEAESRVAEKSYHFLPTDKVATLEEVQDALGSSFKVEKTRTPGKFDIYNKNFANNNDSTDFYERVKEYCKDENLYTSDFSTYTNSEITCFIVKAETSKSMKESTVVEGETQVFDELGSTIDELRSKISNLMKSTTDKKWSTALGQALSAISTLDRNLSNADAKLGVIPLKESRDTKLYVYPTSKKDHQMISNWLERSDFHAEENPNYFMFPVKGQRDADATETDLDKEFAKLGANVRYELE